MAHFALDFSSQRSVWWYGQASLMACSSPPPVPSAICCWLAANIAALLACLLTLASVGLRGLRTRGSSCARNAFSERVRALLRPSRLVLFPRRNRLLRRDGLPVGERLWLDAVRHP